MGQRGCPAGDGRGKNPVLKMSCCRGCSCLRAPWSRTDKKGLLARCWGEGGDGGSWRVLAG